MKIELNVVGSYCNSWPNLIVEVNKNKIYDGEIQGEQNLKLEFNDTIKLGNQFIIGMTNKRFGKGGVWDTVTENNVIVKDKTIQIKSIKLDDVECKTLFNNVFYVRRTDRQPTYFPDKVESLDTMNYNGYFSFLFDIPLYNSLINKKFKQDLSDDISYFSNYTKVFHYEEEIELINSIKDTLKEINEKFSSQRSKIRNS
jgi:hypothetical protein